MTLLLTEFIFILFSLCFLIVVFSFVNRIYILWLYKKTASIQEPQPITLFDELPYITIQLPIFNESVVVERLINNICNIDYPRDRLEIQVLDDSTDDTKRIASILCEQKKAMGHNIKHITREERIGFKAGALQHGLQHAQGDFVAIFDSDFMPQPDFLKRTVHFFTEEKIGWVQTRWTHLNEKFSLLTQCSALFCDALFKVESSARSKLNHWGIFNGTAGIIRKAMIDDAGGWHWDTITEDSDLSYRALAKGWKYITLAETSCPCELPPTLPDFIEQQTRWSKGNIQVVKKLFSKILSANVGLINKYDFISYLTNYLFFPAITLFALLIMPTILLNDSYTYLLMSPYKSISRVALGIFCMSMGVAIVYLFFKNGQIESNKKPSYILVRTLSFMFMSFGLAPFISVAVFEGFFKDDKNFIRTPKYAITDKINKTINNSSSSKKIRLIARCCILMGIYLLASVAVCLYNDFYATLLFLPTLIVFGFAFIYFGVLIAFPNQKIFRNIFEYKHHDIDDEVEKSFSV